MFIMWLASRASTRSQINDLFITIVLVIEYNSYYVACTSIYDIAGI